MTEARRTRPPKLTTACLYLGLVFAFQLINVFVVLGDWNSLDGQKRVNHLIEPFVEEGMSRGDAETSIRVALTVLAILAASGIVFAVYTALGHVVSRVMVSILGVMIGFVCVAQGSFVGTLQCVVAFTCVIQLWLIAEIRTWFDVRSGKTAPVKTADWPRPVSAQPQVPQPQASVPTDGTQPPVHPYAPPRPRRDGRFITAVVTLVVSSLIALGCGVYLLSYEFAREELVRQQLESGMNWMDLTREEILDSLRQLAVLSWTVLPLSVIAMVASTVVLLRRRGRR